MKDYLRRESVVDIQDDGDPYWFNNPQYRLSADEPLEVRLSTAFVVHQVVVHNRLGNHHIVPLFTLTDSEKWSYNFVGYYLVVGVHQLDATGQEISKPPAGKLPYCLRSGTDKAPYDAQEVGTWLLSQRSA